MAMYLRLMQHEPNAGVRAVLGHFLFVYIHPYMDGNGRLARVTVDDVAEVIRRQSVIVLPSYREGMPRVILEAMAAGVACVGCDVPGVREAIRDGESGLLAAPRDADDLAAKLGRLLDDPVLLRKLGRRGNEIARECFDLPIVLERQLDVYRELGVAPG